MSSQKRLERALREVGALSFAGIGYRFVALRYADPDRALSGEGASSYGGRYNPRGLRAVYLSEDARTAVAETGYGVSLGGRFSGKDREPRLLLAVEFRLGRVLDLRGDEVQRALGITRAEMTSPGWREASRSGFVPPTQAVGLAAYRAKFEGLVVPSAAMAGAYNLVVFVDNLQAGSELRLAGRAP